MPESRPLFYILKYPGRRELRIGTCDDPNAFFDRLELECRHVDFDCSWVASIPASLTHALRSNLYAMRSPAFTTSGFPPEDAYSLHDDTLVWSVPAKHQLDMQRVSTLLQCRSTRDSASRPQCIANTNSLS